MSDALTLKQAADAWDILMEECGAREKDTSMYSQFLYYVTKPEPSGHEFRFMGKLGFGGKFVTAAYRGWRVTCYREDETPERLAAIERANARLAELHP